MVDREKVIKGLELCMNGYCHSGCPYNHITVGCRKQLDADAISLLKEQEAVKPTWSLGKPFCGACGLRIHGGKFCSECGKPILWGGQVNDLQAKGGRK